MRGRMHFKNLFAILSLGLLAVASFAQIQNARVEGSVADASHAFIPGAKLTITNVKTQVKTDAESNQEGFFVFPVLQPGIYTLFVEANGFRKATITNIEVNIGVTIR